MSSLLPISTSPVSTGPLARLSSLLKGTSYPITKGVAALIVFAALTLVFTSPSNVVVERAGEGLPSPTTPSTSASLFISILRFLLFPMASSPLLLAIFYTGCFIVCSTYMERLWEWSEYASFLGGSYTVLLAYHTLWLGILAAGKGVGFFSSATLNGAGLGAGLDGVLAGFSVAFKLIIPEHHVKVGGLMFFRVKQIPSIIIAFYITLFLLGVDRRRLGIVFCGIVQSWVYLRFIHRRAVTSGTARTVLFRGHISEEFGALSFFPDMLHPTLDPLFTGVYARVNQVVRGFGGALGTSQSEQAALLGNMEEGGGIVGSVKSSIPAPTNLKDAIGGNPAADADRRRALALKALEMRLEAKESQATVNSVR